LPSSKGLLDPPDVTGWIGLPARESRRSSTGDVNVTPKADYFNYRATERSLHLIEGMTQGQSSAFAHKPAATGFCRM